MHFLFLILIHLQPCSLVKAKLIWVYITYMSVLKHYKNSKKKKKEKSLKSGYLDNH